MIRAFLTVLLLVWGTVALSQDAAPDAGPEAEASAVAAPVSLDPEWDKLAARAVEAIEAARASTPIFEDMRAELAGWREEFAALQSANSRRIATVQAQIDALGEASETEAPDITALRQRLTEQIATLSAPGARAAEAYAEADGLISEIDAIIRDRQTEAFLSRDTSPLNPTAWTPALDDLGAALRATWGETGDVANDPNQRQTVLDNLPALLLLAVIALVTLLRGRRWIGWLERQVSARTSRGRGVWTFVVSLGKVILPLIGLVALSVGLLATGIPGRRLTALIGVLPFVGLYPIVAHWLAGQLLPQEEDAPPGPLNLTHGARVKLKRRFIWLGYLMAVAGAVVVWLETSGISGTSSAVLQFPFGAAAALAIWMIGRVLMRGHAEAAPDPETGEAPRSFRDRLLSLLGQLLMLDAAIGVGLAVLGFVSAFETVVFPAAGTLFLLAFLVLLQRLVFDLYALLAGREAEGQDGLIPVTLSFLLALGAVPVLALIWGARRADLTELWTRFQEGFDIGGTVISPGNFLTFVIVFVIGYTAVRLMQAALKTSVLPRTRMDVGGQNAVSAGVGYLGIFLSAVVAITMAGIDLSGLAIVAGALSVGIGFGLQNIVSNFVSGIILLIERPISEGDWIEVGGQMGYVRDISVRSTRIETFDRTDVIVPNADLVSGTVTNYTRGNTVGRLIIPVGVAYGTDTRRVTEVLQEIAEAHPMVLLNPKPSVVFQGFGADSLDFEIRAILRDVNWMLSVKTEMNHQIAERFVAEGFEIPFAQRDIWLRNPEALSPGSPIVGADAEADDAPEETPEEDAP